MLRPITAVLKSRFQTEGPGIDANQHREDQRREREPLRYRESSKKDKGRILDEFIAVTGHHRKHGIRLLGQSGDAGEKLSMIKGRRIYDESVREAVILIGHGDAQARTAAGGDGEVGSDKVLYVIRGWIGVSDAS